MYEILERTVLGPAVNEFKIKAPLIAEKAKAGQFVVLRVNETGERFPLTIADRSPEQGTLTLVVQEMGKSSKLLGTLQAGDVVLDVIGPLGVASEIENYGTAVCVGGGVGIACIFPIARALKQAGNNVISIIGARTKDLLIWEDRMREASDQVLVTTDDGSYGKKGFVTDELRALLEGGTHVDLVYAVGPAIMMKFVAKVTKEFNVRTIASLNSVMVDGTGMCGGCRVQVGDDTKFVCVDGPEFDAHEVDFDELIQRQQTYKEEERESLERFERKGLGKDRD